MSEIENLHPGSWRALADKACRELECIASRTAEANGRIREGNISAQPGSGPLLVYAIRDGVSSYGFYSQLVRE